MPKNKISEKYMENVKIFRGPTHDIPNLPQFSPPKSMFDPLANIKMDEYFKQAEG